METAVVFQNTAKAFCENRQDTEKYIKYLQDVFEVFGKTTEFTTDLLEVSLNNKYQGYQ